MQQKQSQRRANKMRLSESCQLLRRPANAHGGGVAHARVGVTLCVCARRDAGWCDVMPRCLVSMPAISTPSLGHFYQHFMIRFCGKNFRNFFWGAKFFATNVPKYSKWHKSCSLNYRVKFQYEWWWKRSFKLIFLFHATKIIVCAKNCA